MEEAIWKPIIGFDGIYDYDQFGNVKSLGNNRKRKEKKLKPYIQKGGYKKFVLNKKKNRRTAYAHQLVWEYYNGPIPIGYDVHHKDNNPLNNDISNLGIIKKRMHNGEHKTALIKSHFVGVNKSGNYWVSRIYFNKRHVFLGSFKDELLAKNAYTKALDSIEKGHDLHLLYPKKSRINKHIYYYKRLEKWRVQVNRLYIGDYKTEEEARHFRNVYCENARINI